MSYIFMGCMCYDLCAIRYVKWAIGYMIMGHVLGCSLLLFKGINNQCAMTTAKGRRETYAP